MLNARKVLFATVVAVGSMSSLAMADSGSRYVQKRIPMGPRADIYVLVRADEGKRVERPYALTGEPRHEAERRPVYRPLHRKGTHGDF